MRRCIILTLKFPPQQDTAAQRPEAWARYLYDEGIWPIIITKNYGSNIKADVEHEITDRYEVYRLNIHTTLFYQYKGQTEGIGKLKRKLAVFASPWFNTSFLFGPFKKMKAFVDEYLHSKSNVDLIIATGKPFGLFKVAHRLSRKHGMPWMADYRDDWTTTELPTSPLVKYLNKYRDHKLEKKWLNSAAAFTTVSRYYRDKISRVNLNRTPGFVIENGFFEEQFLDTVPLNSILSFVYVGSLYATQDVDSVVLALLEASMHVKNKGPVNVVFIGTKISEERKNEWLKNYPESNVEISILPRMPKSQALQIQRACHYAMIIPHAGLKGIPSSKLYEFIGAKMRTIVFPNDHDVIHETLSGTGLGVFADNLNELRDQFIEIISSYAHKNPIHHIDKSSIASYSRRSTTKKLAEIIKKLTTST
ncbi:MAG: hypothetical protein P1U56_02180 [Saprospiraceae bacterium]|nr:hypothetical protein [Saprospiraceae bacterium]